MSFVQRAVRKPRVRAKAQQGFDDEIRPRAKESRERARPDVETAREKALKRAAGLADQLNRRIQKSTAARREQAGERPEPPETEGS